MRTQALAITSTDPHGDLRFALRSQDVAEKRRCDRPQDKNHDVGNSNASIYAHSTSPRNRDSHANHSGLTAL
jgi:hypothetical protein